MFLRSARLGSVAISLAALLGCKGATYTTPPTSDGSERSQNDAGDSASNAQGAGANAEADDSEGPSDAQDTEQASTENGHSDDVATSPAGDDPPAPNGDGSDGSDVDDSTSDDGAEPVDSDVTDGALPGDDSSRQDAGSNANAPDGTLRIPGRIEAEAFARFNEQDVANDMGDCGDGPVDVATSDGAQGGCYVGWTQGGEWLEYDVWADSSAQFQIELNLAADVSSEVVVLVDGDEAGSVDSPADGWTAFDDVALGSVQLAAGEHVVRVRFVAGQVNFDYLLFRATDVDPEPSATDPQPVDPQPVDPQPVDPQPMDPQPNTEGCAAAPEGYALVWSDTFDDDGLPDPTRWGYQTGGDGFGNNELQYYTDGRIENASVSEGLLTVTAINEEYMGNSYTSAKLNSGLGEGNPGTWNEGIFQIRARLPSGLGTWPALWMMPTDCAEGWPNCGEIDIMEHVGYDEGVVHGTIHTDAFNHVEGTQNGNQVQVADATSAFHTYTLVWTTERLEWQVDGAVYHSVDREADWGFAEWPFDEKLWHLMINVAVGGDWGGAEGVESSDYPARFELDSVCVYQ